MKSTLTQTMARFLLVPILVVAVAVLIKGYAAVGDGFSAGVIAASGIVLQYMACGYREVERELPAVRYAAVLAIAGLWLALVVAFTPVVWGGPVMLHVPLAGAEVLHLGALEFHSAVLFDIGVFSLVLGFITSTVRIIARINGGTET